MLLRHKISTVIALCLLMQACGFTPVYQRNGDEKGLSPQLKTIVVSKIGRSIRGVKLKSELEDIFNPTGGQSWQHYILNVSIEYRKDPMLIEQNRDINRYNIMMKGSFNLIEKATGKVLYQDVSRLTNGYRVLDSDFATLSSEEDTEKRIITEMAKDISFKISDFLLSRKEKKAAK